MLQIEPGQEVREWRRYWTLPLAGAMGYSAAGLQSYGFGPFVELIEREFDWSRAQVMLGLTIPGVFAFLFSIPAGIAIDRIGPRRVGMFGLAAMCGGFALLSTATGTMLNWSILWAIVSIGVIFVQAPVWTSAVTSRFDKGRGLAIAATLVGSSVTATVAPLIAAFLLDGSNWQFAMATLGIIWLAVTFPIVFFLFRGRQDGLARGARPTIVSEERAFLPGLTVREALRLPTFWIIAGSNFAFAFYTMSLAPNLVPLLGEKGASPVAAAQIASLVGIVSIVARLTAGHLLDRFPSHLVAAAIFLLPVVGCSLLLVDSPSYLILAMAVASFGATIGAEYDVIYYMISRHVGLRNFGSLLGIIMTAAGLAGIGAPVIAGLIHDRTGNYELHLTLLAAMMSVASVAMLRTGKKNMHSVVSPSAANPGNA